MAAFVKKYPVTAWLIVATAVSLAVTALVIAHLVPDWVALFATFGSSLAGLGFAAFIDGKAGVYEMLNRLRIWRVGLGWWAVAILALAPIVLVGITLNAILDLTPFELSELSVILNVVPGLVVFTVLSGLGEELGWRGFVLPRLQARYTALVASIFVAFIWTLWHVPLFFSEIEDLPYFGLKEEYGPAVAIGGFFLYLSAWSVLFTWMFNNTSGSLLLVSVFHASQVWVHNLPVDVQDPKLYVPGLTTAMVVAMLAVIVYYGPQHLSRTATRITYQSPQPPATRAVPVTV